MRNMQQKLSKTLGALVLFAAIVSAFPACNKKNNPLDEMIDTEEKGPSLTLGEEKVTAVSAVLKGRAILGDAVATDLSVGILWSAYPGVLPSNSTKEVAMDMDGDYNYRVQLSHLAPEKTYWFRSYVTENGQTQLGEVKSFTTKPLASMLETLDATDLTKTSVKLKAKLDLADVPYTSLSCNFLFGLTNPPSSSDLLVGRLDGNSFSAEVGQLSAQVDSGYDYYCQARVILDGHMYTGKVKGVALFREVSSIALDKTNLSLILGDATPPSLSASISPSYATNKTLEWVSDNEMIARVDQNGRVFPEGEGSTVITAYATDGSGKFASCYVSVYRIDKPEAVDLGLPSGTKWASFNLGASAPEGYGLYFAWGETRPKANCSWGTYKWCNGEYNTLTKYCGTSMTSYWAGKGTPDGKTVLDREDDAAAVWLGGTWHTPTEAEWAELGDSDNCSWEPTNINGVNGVKVTSKRVGFTNSWIFLPAAGYRDGTANHEVNVSGYYWYPSLRADYPSDAWHLWFDSYEVPVYVQKLLSARLFGQSVRPVSK